MRQFVLKRPIPRGIAVLLLSTSLLGLGFRVVRPAEAAETISFVGGSSASALAKKSLTIPTPLGVVSRDLMLAVFYSRGKPTITDPVGWTLIRENGKGRLCFRVAGEGEPPSFTWNLDSSHNMGGAILAFRGVDSSAPIQASSGEKHNEASTDIKAPSITATLPGGRLVAFFGIDAGASITPPSELTERLEMTTGGNKPISWEVSDAYQESSGSTGDKTAVADAAGTNVGQLVVLTPEQEGGGSVYRAFKITSYWNTPLPPDAPVDPNSAEIIDWMKADSTTNYVHFAGTESDGKWGMPIYWAGARDPTYAVTSPCKTLPPELSSIRIPRGTKADDTSDGAFEIFDVEKGLVYSLFQATYDTLTDEWQACGAAAYYTSSNGLVGSLPESDEPDNTGHRGVPPAMFAVRFDEVQAGSIDHVLKIAINNTKCEHVFPMNGDECGVTDSFAPPEGTLMRLKASIDLSKYTLTPAALLVATALQTYGAVIGDQSSGPVSLKVENTIAEGFGDLWTGLLKKDSLSAFSLDDYQIIQLGYEK